MTNRLNNWPVASASSLSQNATVLGACPRTQSAPPSGPPTRLRLLLVLAGFFATVAHTQAGAQPWAVIKCKFSDQPNEPFFDPAFITSAAGMAGYWQAVSYGQAPIDGSAVFPANGGWFTLPITLAQGQALTRQQRIEACMAAATGVDLSQFFSVIAIVNVPVDSGSVNRKVLLDPNAWNVSFAAHEMGHCYGLDHSFDDTGRVYDPKSDGRPGAYGDGWDIMSAMNFGNSSPTFSGTYGPSGPGLTTLNLEKLGWLAADRIHIWNQAAQDIALAAVNQPQPSGALMAKVPFDDANPDHYYAVEYRRKTGWDAGLPGDSVVIHERRTDGLFYLIRANGGAQRLSGQTFLDANNNLVISVLNLNPNTSTAVVNIGRNEEWVDFNYQGDTERGTFDQPHNTLVEGLNTVGHGGTLKIKTGARNETALISKKLVIEAYGGPVTIGR